MRARESVTCPQFRDAVTEYLEDAQSRGDRESFESHKDSCGSCQDFLNEIVDCIEGLGRLRVDDLTPEREAELVALLDRREPTEEEIDGQVGATPEEMLRELMTHSPEQRAILIENSGRFKSVELCQLALDRGFEMGAQDPGQALELTSLAVLIADSIDVESFSSGLVIGLRAKAYALKGNASRVASDLIGAARALNRASELAGADVHDQSVQATVLALQGAFLGEQLDFQGAFAALDRAIAIYKQIGDTADAVRATLMKAMHLANSGRPDTAVQSLHGTMAEADELGIPRLSLIVRHNLAFSLLACGRSEEAQRLVPEVRNLHFSVGNAVDLTRFKWLEGQIAVDTDRLSEAETLFLEVKQFFVDKEMAHDAALVSLDLALVYLRQGRVAELKSLAAEMLTIFRSLRVHQETLAALAFCRKSLEVEQMTVGLLRELASCLEKARERARFGAGMSVAE